ncbi:hypothetical protein ACFYPZ_12115 [Streptomyces sp. NPDC005506]|uniref:hypothetical protein n=1 Tax=unclassified Streptomyces TaxID=2593676 RepID=UPI00368AAF29
MLEHGTRETSRASVGSCALRGAWLTRGKDGRLTVYASAEGGLQRWTEQRPGGPRWTRPEFFAAPHLTDLSLVQDSNGYVHFIARRERRAAGKSAVADIMYAIQYQTGRPVSQWRSLGNPHKDAESSRAIGVPVGVVTPSGVVHICLPNGRGGLALRREQPDGKWRPWEDFGGMGIESAPAIVALSTDRVEIFASTQLGTAHWSQQKPGGPWGEAQPSRFAVCPGTAVGLETGPDRTTYYWTDPAGLGVVAYRAGGWPMPLGGAPGDGPHSTMRAFVDGYDCTLLAHRGANGTAVIGVGVTEGESNGMWWSDTGMSCSGTPALAEDAFGRVVMAVIDDSGEPRVARQTDGPGLTLAEWQTL